MAGMIRRPTILRLSLDFAGYFAAASAAVAATRLNGGVALIWLASALLLGRLGTAPRRHWPAILVTCALASALATSMFGVGPIAAPALALVNIGEAALTAWLLRRARSTDPFQSLDWLVRFVGAAGLLAPFLSALCGATIVHLATGGDWTSNALGWFVGHSLGTLTFAPLATFLMRNDLSRWRSEAGSHHTRETVLLLGLVFITSVGVFGQSRTPLLFLPLLPMILTTFRVGRFGAAASLVLLAVIGGGCTVAGVGPIALMPGVTGAKLQFFQFYLAATVLTILPVAADLARRNQLFRALRDSEARYRLLAETSTDIILNLDPDGCIRFISPSIRQLGGYEPSELIGRNAAILVAPGYRAAVAASHAATLRAGGQPVSLEYLGVARTGTTCWIETHARAIVTDTGEVDGIVSIVRDISARKALEEKLAADALTDPVTGLANRRAFLSIVDRQMAQGGATGCIALFDLDHFKRVNDGWGHAAGDQVLRTFAEVARRTLRSGDHVARIGGEEFAVLLPSSSIEQAELVCERLRQAVAATPTAHEGFSIRVTVSGGVAPLSGSGDEALRVADMALYRAKAAGRDQLALAA
jgi:diguanylate cyclase (GGDEF)-like protein/PAS domain S-box-containing protein